MIAIIDYGAGNLRSVMNAFEFIGQSPALVTDPDELARADAIVLPGVGSFGEGMENLKILNLIEPLSEEVVVKRKPYLGICLGLQFLANDSREHGTHEGFGWVPGTVERIRPCNGKFRVPHMGWNNVKMERPSPLCEGIEPDSDFYFVHSYHFVPADGNEGVVSMTAWHGQTVTAAVEQDNIFGVQFHPEKSQRCGLNLLENFTKLIR